MLWLPHSYYQPRTSFAGSGGGGGGGYSPVSSQAIDFVARALSADGSYDSTHHDADALCIDTIVAADSGVTWGLIDCIHAPQTQGLAAVSLLNWTSSSFTATLSGSPVLTADLGYTGGGTKKFNSGFNASTAGGNYTDTNCSFFIMSLDGWTSGQDSGSLAGYTTSSSGAFFLYPHYSDNNFYINTQNTIGNSAAHTGGTHWYGFTKGTIPGCELYQGTAHSTGGAASTSLVNDTFNYLGDNAAGYRPYAGSFSVALVAGYLTPTQVGYIQSAFNTRSDTLHGSH